jgi:kinesin family member C2/C3
MSDAAPTYPRENAIAIKDVQSTRTREFDYEFDRVFLPRSKQDEVFEEVRWLATSVLDGFNVCIMAYGQTGSGKTHTMFGPPSVQAFEGQDDDRRGINFRILEELFSLTEQRKDHFSYKFKVSMMEVYNDAVFDLLLRDPTQLRQKKLHVQMLHHNVVTIPGLIEHTVTSASDVITILNQGISNRKVRYSGDSAI